MFTGLVETVGVWRRKTEGVVARAFIETSLSPLTLGESISVNGVCLTVDRIHSNGFEADLSSETLARTTLGQLALGSPVHLERAAALGSRLGGHIVLGHVDAFGRVSQRKAHGEALEVQVSTSQALARFLAPKGSIALDGVSLTLNTVEDGRRDDVLFSVMLVPHTLKSTTFGKLSPGARLNVEVDVFARYVARQFDLFGQGDTPPKHFGLEIRDESAYGSNPTDEQLLAKLRSGGFV